MGPVGDILFGSEPEANIESRPTLSPEQLQILRETLLPFIEGMNLDPGMLDPSQAAETSLEALEQRALALANPESGQTSSQQALANIFQGGVNFDPSGATESGLATFTDPEAFNQFFTEGVTEPALRELNETILPGISRRFAPSGFFGSERIESDRRAVEDLIQTTTGERSRGFLDRSLGAAIELERSKRGDLDRGLQEAGLDTEAILNAIGLGGTEGVDLRNIAAILESSEFARLGELDKINVVLGALGLRTQENIATVTGGTQGLVQAFLGSEGGSAAVGQAAFGN